MGDYNPVTVDKWFMRTMGRYTGNIAKGNQANREAWFSRLREAIKAGGEDMEKAGISVSPDASDDELARFAADLTAWRYTKGKEAYGKVPDSELFKAAKNLREGVAAIKEMPTQADRAHYRDIVNQARELLLVRDGIDLDSASLQATIWYPEQDLYRAMGSAQSVKREDYGSAISEALNVEPTEKALFEQSRGVLEATRRNEYQQFSRARAVAAIRRGLYARATGGSSGAYSGRGTGDGASFRILSGNNRTHYESKILRVHTPKKGPAKAMTKGGIAPVPILELDMRDPNAAKAFHASISKAKRRNKFGSSVHVYSPKEYAASRLFVTPDGKSGAAITKDGDIISVFSDGTEGWAQSAMLLAIQNGGRKADSFNTVLPRLYSMAGMRPVARVKWNEAMKPGDWDKALYRKFNNGEPDVVLYAYDPGFGPAQFEEAMEKAPVFGPDEWDKADALRDQWFEENGP